MQKQCSVAGLRQQACKAQEHGQFIPSQQAAPGAAHLWCVYQQRAGEVGQQAHSMQAAVLGPDAQCAAIR